MRTDMIEINAFIRRDLARTIAIWDGAYDDDGAEIWTWLPKSLIEYHGTTVRLPEWLARDRDLEASIDRQQTETAKLKARIADLEGRLANVERRLAAISGVEQTRH